MTGNVDLSELSDATILAMHAAAGEASAAMHAAHRANSNVVWDFLRFEKEVAPERHYPDDNAFDPESGSQYYYHMHRPGEHGHFHCFIMHDGLPETAEPVPDQDLHLRDPGFTDPFAHLIAISMDEFGHPKGLFTTNRWVTQEVIYPADQIIALLDRFRIDHTFPAWSTNRWLTAMIVLFRPQIESLIRAREATFGALREAHPDRVVYEDTDNEILSFAKIDIAEHSGAVAAEHARRWGRSR